MRRRARHRRRDRFAWGALYLGAPAVVVGVFAATEYNLNGRGPARGKATRVKLGTLQHGIKEYQSAIGSLPPCLEALQTGGRDSILDPDRNLLDAWGRSFVYRPELTSGHRYLLCSKGPDGVSPSNDDVSVWELDR